MERKDLIAPETYNLTSEMEAFAGSGTRMALQWQNDQGDTEDITYQSLFHRANQFAQAMYHQGLAKGDRILIMMPRLIDAYIAYIGSLKAGLVVIPASEMLRSKDLSYRIKHGEAKAVVSYYPYIDQFEQITETTPSLSSKIIVGGHAEGWQSLSELMADESEAFSAAETHRDDMAFLAYTSGTTGHPKGVVHSHGWAYAHLRTSAKSWLAIEEGNVVWATAGPGWAKWVWSPFVATLGSGATGLIYQGKFEPNTYLSLLENYRVNVLCCTPTEYRFMAKVDDLARYQLSDLQSAVSAGEPLNREVIDTFKDYFDINVRDGYGQTENTLIVGNLQDMPIKPGSMGKPTPGNTVDVISDEGQPVEAGEVGDIAVHKDTPALFKTYYKDDERMKQAFRGDYYLTGDKAKKDDDGYFWFEGRSDDIIISAGYTIGPFEVEDALVKHPAVKECAVVASPDPDRGDIVKAFVILRHSDEVDETLLKKELQQHVKDLTAPYKYPRNIEFIDELPKTTSGKIRRIELRDREK